MNNFTEKEAEALIKSKLSRYFGVTEKEATKEQIYKATVMCVKDILLEKRSAFNRKYRSKGGKRVYYLCMEFLLGQSLKNNTYNLNMQESLDKALRKCFNCSLEDLYDMEPDAGLGNGGLGRLAACFMDALASQNYPALGYSIRYEYGLFKQKIVDGWQMELPDIWLPGGEIWLTQRQDKTFNVKFDGFIKENWTENGLKIEHCDAKEVEAVAYDMMISGKDCEAVSVLRLWVAQNRHDFDMKTFSQGDYMRCMQEDNEAELISKVLYPSDNHFEGKSLRLKQQYLLVSASLQDIVQDHLKRYGTLDSLPDKAAIHINDTHPALCIPELMRILIDDHGYSWEAAWSIVTRTVAYTNHTVMSEALEKWNEDLIARRLPRIYSILKEINQRFCAEMWNRFPGDWDKIDRMSIFSHSQIKMANLSVIASHKVNGVSALHSKIIKESIFKDFNDVFPEKFTNVTNGIAYRRWLCQSNPELSSLITECIGDGFVKDAAKLIGFKDFENDERVLNELNKIKALKKKQFCDFAKKKQGVIIDPETMFDVQAKRMHEYKRQLLNALYIISLYNDLKENPNLPVQPKTFIFGAKAAPGYYFAKQIIRLICCLSEDIKKNPKINAKLNVVYMEDYNVTMAEKLMPSTEISEQISQAGKEASGTGNMKFMINGALTIGTLDGANVEMREACGDENIFIFGLTAREVNELWSHGYNSTGYYNNNKKLEKVIDALNKGFNGVAFDDIARYLLVGSPVADPYMCLADFGSYCDIHAKADEVYKDKMLWARKSLNNIATSGIFSADRAIREYADNIWNLKRM
ncbi:MAG: glycogen/starch/alpha-glucan phosphorylase [Candidatus Borkfalkiaceae bacterium]|nr:glycogen/starch/alpha-glucan phosphorylase [Christensenellaceae bacterium]